MLTVGILNVYPWFLRMIKNVPFRDQHGNEAGPFNALRIVALIEK